MEPATEDVAYLARSPSRVAILRALADEPMDRHDVLAAVDASRVTIGRILGAFEERHWVTRDGPVYEPTRLGRLVLAAFDELTETTRLARTLGPLAEELPSEFFDVDLRHLADATVVRATDADPLAVARVAGDLMAEAGEVKVFAHAIAGTVVEAQTAAARAGQPSTVVVDADLLATIAADDGLRSQVRDLLATGRATYVVAEGPVPISVGVYDDETVAIGFTDDGLPNAAIVTDDEAVCSWAIDRLDDFLRGGTELTVADFSD